MGCISSEPAIQPQELLGDAQRIQLGVEKKQMVATIKKMAKLVERQQSQIAQLKEREQTREKTASNSHKLKLANAENHGAKILSKNSIYCLECWQMIPRVMNVQPSLKLCSRCEGLGVETADNLINRQCPWCRCRPHKLIRGRICSSCFGKGVIMNDDYEY